MKFNKVKQKKISDIIYEQLREKIISSELSPDEKLPPERELAAMMSVSRPSLREALHRLEDQGLLEQIQGDGTYVRSIAASSVDKAFEEFFKHDDALLHLMEVRKILETWAARTAAERATDKELHTMEEYLKEMKQALDNKEVGHVPDANFHNTISYATHNFLLIHLMNSIYEWIEKVSYEVRSRLFKDNDKFANLYNQHVAVFEAMQGQNPDAAYDAMLAHMDYIISEIKLIQKSK
ncbi:MAG: FadR family transcriptional regulator [Denitrovibrio sp.]|nr:MAG: FadR family transcriptional regulator [Denitrovibrio sp.]